MLDLKNDRKIFEAMFIFNLKPNINDKAEKKVLERFLVSGDEIHSLYNLCFNDMS